MSQPRRRHGVVRPPGSLRGRQQAGAGIFFHAGLKISRLYAKDVFIKRISKPTSFGRNGGPRHDTQRPYALCISTPPAPNAFKAKTLRMLKEEFDCEPGNFPTPILGGITREA